MIKGSSYRFVSSRAVSQRVKVKEKRCRLSAENTGGNDSFRGSVSQSGVSKKLLI